MVTQPKARVDGPPSWTEVRRDFLTQMSRITYLDSGELGISARQVWDAKKAWEQLTRQFGSGHPLIRDAIDGLQLPSSEDFPEIGDDIRTALRNWAGIEVLRSRVANLVGADSHEIMFTRNTTEALMRVVESLPHLANKKILVTDAEHDAAYAAVNFAHQHRHADAKPVIVPVQAIIQSDGFDAECIRRFKSNMEDGVGLVIISHVLYNTGMRLPVREIIRECRKINKHAYFLIDGAHALGQLAIDVHDMDCDFYVTAGHKWLGAPKASGLLFCKDRLWQELEPWPGGAFDPPPKHHLHPNQTESWPEAAKSSRFDQKVEFGTVDDSVFPAFNEAIVYWTGLGEESITHRIGELRRSLKQRLRSSLPIDLVPRDDTVDTGGIVAFKVSRIQRYDELAAVVSKLAREHRVVCRAVPTPSMVGGSRGCAVGIPAVRS